MHIHWWSAVKGCLCPDGGKNSLWGCYWDPPGKMWLLNEKVCQSSSEWDLPPELG